MEIWAPERSMSDARPSDRPGSNEVGTTGTTDCIRAAEHPAGVSPFPFQHFDLFLHSIYNKSVS